MCSHHFRITDVARTLIFCPAEIPILVTVAVDSLLFVLPSERARTTILTSDRGEARVRITLWQGGLSRRTILFAGCLAGYKFGWLDAWRKGWMETWWVGGWGGWGRVGGWLDGWMDDGRMGGWMEMAGWLDGWREGGRDGWMGE